MFELKIDKKAGEELEKFPKEIRERIFIKLLQAKENPHHFFIRLEGRNDYKLRIGHYRVIADINPEQEIIEVTKVGHRKHIYDNP
jgi:mRNA interferase RelE/StbE